MIAAIIITGIVGIVGAACFVAIRLVREAKKDRHLETHRVNKTYDIS